MNDLQLYADAALAPSGKVALQKLPRQQALWVGGSALAAAVAGASSLWTWAPELALCIALGVGASVVNVRKLWAAPLVVAAVAAVGLACGAIGVPPVVGAGAAAGALSAWLVPHRTDALDLVNGALGSLTGASLGLWAAVALLPSTLPPVLLAPLTLGLVSLVAAQGLLPVALRFDLGPSLPSRAEVARTLRVPYRPPVMRALELYRHTHPHVPERDTRRGLAEMAMWVYRLQQTLQTLDKQLEQIDPDHVEARIRACKELADDVDSFTRERRQATAIHLERLLERRRAIAVERDRTDALVDYSLAFLEEARAGMTVAQHLPGENVPERLDEVLDRLREYAREGDTRRQTAREVELQR